MSRTAERCGGRVNSDSGCGDGRDAIVGRDGMALSGGGATVGTAGRVAGAFSRVIGGRGRKRSDWLRSGRTIERDAGCDCCPGKGDTQVSRWTASRPHISAPHCGRRQRACSGPLDFLCSRPHGNLAGVPALGHELGGVAVGPTIRSPANRSGRWVRSQAAASAVSLRIMWVTSCALTSRTSRRIESEENQPPAPAGRFHPRFREPPAVGRAR